MNELHKVLADSPTNVARAALYYASRYLKQASAFDRYQKDIFEDDQRSQPNDLVRSLTRQVIGHIESAAGMKAANFPDSVYAQWAAEIGRTERALNSNFSETNIRRAKELLESMETPLPRDRDL